MDSKESIWSRRNNASNLSLSTPANSDSSSFTRDYSSLSKRSAGASSSHGRSNPFNAATTPGGGIASPTGGASNQFGLGSGAFGFAGSAKTPKAAGDPFDQAMGAFGGVKTPSTEKLSKDAPKSSATGKPAMGSISETGSQQSTSQSAHPLRDSWVFWFRPPISKANGYVEYEKSVHAIAQVSTVEEFWAVYRHLNHPSALPEKSDYHLFKKGIRPIWEDDENKQGGKWILHLKKGVADRMWDDTMMACIGNGLGDEYDEVCGVVLSVRNGEDVLSIWTRHDGQRNNKVRDALKRALDYKSPLNFVYKSHNESRAKANNHHHGDNQANKRMPHHNKTARQPQEDQRP
ncbi:hypothetical protein DL764_009990 [Monosporascus ibericus]|uniref:Translation initiation factor eIF4E3 n=1 Tax=Monosporascus ibericus TaxID=155417 RepID=A0A4Q4SVJ5_9PEZI|nr:hypothetical protein DL764_009990 [Monosporascus ibericus]